MIKAALWCHPKYRSAFEIVRDTITENKYAGYYKILIYE